MKSLFYPASVVHFQLHRGVVSHIQVLAIPSSTVHNTIYLDPTTESLLVLVSCLFLRLCCRDVTSGSDRQLDINYISDCR